VRLSLRVLDEECQPLEDVIVEIWHTNHEGIYSGNITDMCNDVEEYKSQLFFRGYQRTDAAGVVNFDTCYPGWYSGRVVHIHFRIMTGVYDASDNANAEVISQLFFTDELNNEIFGSHQDYSSFGQPDTQLGNDNVVGGEDDPSPYVLDIQKMSDGVMLASKTIILRSSSAESCSMQGAAGGGPGGGGPGGPGGLIGW
jgi:protocatechuate 3,4-dioxygenase beta subunit